jgi:hypothetical protein
MIDYRVGLTVRAEPHYSGTLRTIRYDATTR